MDPQSLGLIIQLGQALDKQHKGGAGPQAPPHTIGAVDEPAAQAAAPTAPGTLETPTAGQPLQPRDGMPHILSPEEKGVRDAQVKVQQDAVAVRGRIQNARELGIAPDDPRWLDYVLYNKPGREPGAGSSAAALLDAYDAWSAEHGHYPNAAERGQIRQTQEAADATAKREGTHSAIFREWEDYKTTGGKLGFDAYQTMDANRKRPVTSINNPDSMKAMAEETARNLVDNPRDLVSLRNVVSMRGMDRQMVFNALKRLDPNCPVGMIDRQIRFLDEYEDPKGRAAINRKSISNFIQHGAMLSDINKVYRRSNTKIANTVINAVRSQYSDAYTQYVTPLSVLKSELQLYFAGGYGPMGEDKKNWERIQADDATPNQVEAFVKDIIKIGLVRADTDNESFKSMMGYDDPNLITPQAREDATRLGLGKEVSKYGSGGRLGAKSDVSAPFTYEYQGQILTFKSQTALDLWKRAAGIK
jgi:hypothetical protein